MNFLSSIPIKVVIADDHPVFIDGLRFMFRKQKFHPISVVGEASNGKELLEVIAKEKPHVAITDIIMPVMDGIEATKRIHQLFPKTKVLAISMSDETGIVTDMISAGAKGYLLKNDPREEVINSLQVLNTNGIYFSNSSSRLFMKTMVMSNPGSLINLNRVSLSPQETKVMRLISRQQSTKEIASILNLSTRTIDEYRASLHYKVKARCPVGVALYAVRHEIITWKEIDQPMESFKP